MMRFAFLLPVLMLTSGAQAGEYNPTLSIGDPAPAWNDLPGVDDKRHSLSDLKDKDVVVVVFTCNSCPYAVDYEGRINVLAKKHSGKDSKVAVIAINVNKIPEDSLPAMKKRAKEEALEFPYLYDESQQIARDFGATYTPGFFVLNKERNVIYMGAMDDNTVLDKVTEKYVEPAIEAALTGGKLEITETPPVGCRVRYERQRRRP